MRLKNNSVPVYKQIMDWVEDAIKTGQLKPEESLPSMNDLSLELDVSKETVKKAYSILRDKGVLESTQGKGYFVAGKSKKQKMRILVLFDKLSNIKQVLYNSFASTIMERQTLRYTFITSRFHCWNITLTRIWTSSTIM